jgi:ABC-type bacteriocin/lantibiotic exporter with double-glycine peptidase domain
MISEPLLIAVTSAPLLAILMLAVIKIMKSLVDKIIEMLSEKAGSFNPSIRNEFENAIDDVKKIEEEAEFEEVARVMMKHLGRQVEKYHPHHTVITTSTTCELVEGCKSVGRIMDYVAD